MNDKNSICVLITFRSNTIEITRSITSKDDDKLEINTIKLELSVARIFHKVLNKARIVEIFEKSDYELLGSMLYKILVRTEKVKTFFLNIMAEVIRDKESRCRILLEFKEDINELAALPWEYLLIPKIPEREIPSFFLAADHNKQFDLMRYTPINPKVYKSFKPEDQKEINVVLINALDIKESKEPVDNTELVSVFKSLYNQNINEVDENGQVSSKFNSFLIDHPGKGDLQLKLAETIQNIQGPYVLHFYGHAQMCKDGPYLGLIKEGEIDWVEGKFFIDLFDQDSNSLELPVLTVLQACESGQVDENGKGLGIGLVKKGIPAVIAMQNEVTPKASLAFIKKLYTSLLEGEDIAHATTQGRYFLGCEYGKENNLEDEHFNNNTFGTPVLFTNEGDPIQLLPKTEKEKIQSFVKNKYCERCGWKYANTISDRCNRNFCGGKLIEEEKYASATSNTPPDRNRAPEKWDQMNQA